MQLLYKINQPYGTFIHFFLFFFYSPHSLSSSLVGLLVDICVVFNRLEVTWLTITVNRDGQQHNIILLFQLIENRFRYWFYDIFIGRSFVVSQLLYFIPINTSKSHYLVKRMIDCGLRVHILYMNRTSRQLGWGCGSFTIYYLFWILWDTNFQTFQTCLLQTNLHL